MKLNHLKKKEAINDAIAKKMILILYFNFNIYIYIHWPLCYSSVSVDLRGKKQIIDRNKRFVFDVSIKQQCFFFLFALLLSIQLTDRSISSLDRLDYIYRII